MLRGIAVSVALVVLVWLIAFVLIALAGYGMALAPPSPAALDRYRLLFGTMFIALVTFSLTLVFGGIFRWRYTGRVAWFLLGLAGLSWLIAAISPMS